MESIQNTQFVLKQNSDIDQIIDWLCHKYSLHEINQIQLKRYYLDSFDWRLYQKNFVCGIDFRYHEGLFFIHNKATGSSICEFPLDHIPKFSKEFPRNACRPILEDILGVRALTTVATLTIKRRQLLVLNKENKTLAILQAERYTALKHTESIQPPPRLSVFSIRGYEKVSKQFLQYISEQLQLQRAGNALYDEVLAATGQAPNPYAFNITQKLTDSLNTWEAAQILLRHLLDIMQANEDGIRNAIDTEFLHDFRVAVRRTRSILGQLKHVFPEQSLYHFKREFYWLGTITSPTRDLDMYLLKFKDYLQELPSDIQNELKPFRLFLERHWKMEHTRLCKALNSKRYQKLIKGWKQVLENKAIQSQEAQSQIVSAQETVNATKPAKQVAGQRIWRLYKRLIKEGMAITRDSPDEDLHELRKTCKKFRYLIEFFHNYYPNKQIKYLVKTLKQLQENLGDFQDLCVQTTQLNRFAEQMQQEGLANTKTIMAMGVLVERLNTRKAAVRADFSRRFNEFTLPDKKAAFTHAFNPQNQPEGMTV